MSAHDDGDMSLGEIDVERFIDRRPPEEDVVDETAPPMPHGFIVDTEGKAEWTTDMMLASEAGLERRKDQLAGFIREHERLMEFGLSLLTEYFEKNPPKKGKTIKLANANLSMRTVLGGLRVVDEAAVIAWARKNLRAAIAPVFVEKLVGDVVRKHFDDTGEVPPGCELKDDSEKLYVKAPRAPKGK